MIKYCQNLDSEEGHFGSKRKLQSFFKTFICSGMNENNLNTNKDNNIQPFEPIHSALNRFCCYLLKQGLKNLTNRNIASYQKPNIEGKGLPSHSMFENFKTIRAKAESNYMINPTISSNNTQPTSQSINNLTLIIPETQINNFEANQYQKIIDLATDRLKYQINDLKLNIIKAKEKISDENIDSKIEKLNDQINREKKKDFDNAHEKVSRIIARPFIARKNYPNKKRDKIHTDKL
ncbi:hypothetical protein BpHYR1_022423 [Brachionus plicatilis]|uniref:Uncharacterized protein n=1 Tax=Brachionus plicatilis TaxID=10195 RepID=A0A3M7T3W1_BRAPC|nr:hypothetical protein BpHYR1_022423 [Brachionus plicatilis]